MRQQIINEARTWLGVPWRHHGRNRQGIDCVGVGVVVTRDLGIADYDTLTYGRVPSPGLLDGLRNIANEISLQDALPGDFLVMRDSAYPYHVAFLSEKHGVRHIIHAHARRRMVVEEPYMHEWPGMTVAAFKFKGVE